MKNNKVLRIDLAKHIFQLHGLFGFLNFLFIGIYPSMVIVDHILALGVFAWIDKALYNRCCL